jgi:hypothetical protein
MTFNGILKEWKVLSAARPISMQAYTPAGILSLQTDGDNGILDLAPLHSLDAARREHERRRLVEDARMVGLHIVAAAVDTAGAYHYRVRIERGEVTK